MISLPSYSPLFFFTDPATTEIYTLSLHDALPIYERGARRLRRVVAGSGRSLVGGNDERRLSGRRRRSEEHTSELQSLTNLVCRLLLEKKKKMNNRIKTRMNRAYL